ncbi:hypothetical protein Elgi_39380 [Paenibacillus elgii]|uniref:fibronectin type III domain-containing protein n=1 Tax=Paenibacillus elgii TaxID=189691 RepID=UPI002D7A5556|nr:hypothetical protein Elgi_39380 [Paenibacillus elgii]
MKKQSISALFLLLLALIAWTSPGSAEELQPPQATSGTGTQISGDIGQDTVWTKAGSPYIVTTTVQIYENVTLSIEPGVVVKFRNETGLRVGGNLLVNGTQSEPVLFGPETPQSVPSWKGLDLEYIDTNTVRIKHAEFTGATSAIDAGTYPIVNKNPAIIDHVKFANNQTALYGDIKIFNIAFSVFENNGTAIRGSRVFVYDSIIRNNGGGVTDLGDSEERKDKDNFVVKSRIEGNRSYGLKGSGAIYDSIITGNAYGAYVDRVFNGMFGTISIYLYDTKVSGNQTGLLSTTGDPENTIRFYRGELSDNAVGFDGPIPVTESNILRNGLNGVINTYQGSDALPLQNNYWGTTDEQEVASKLKLGSDIQVNYVPLATAPFEAPADAPVWPANSELKLEGKGTVGKITLSWPRAGLYYLLYRNGELLTPVLTDNYTETFTDTMLSPGQTYEYEVFAVSRSGIVSTNALKATYDDNTFPPADWPAGSRLEAKEWKKDSVSLTWTPAENAKEYRVYQDGNLLGTQLGNRNTYFVDQLTPGTTYTFKVEAGNETGNWTTSGPQLTITKNNGDQEPPDISGVQPADNAVVYTLNPVISAVVSDRGVGAQSGIEVYLDEKYLDGKKEDVEKGTVKAPTYGLSNGKHTLRIRAVDLVGNKAESITSFTVAFTPNGLVWPEGSTLSVSKVTSSSLTLNWPPAQGATGYRIYQDGSVVDSVYGEVYSYTVAGLRPETWYTFSVEAVDGAGNVSQKLLTKKARTEVAIEIWPPGSRLEAQERGKDNLILSWTPGKNVWGYTVYQNGKQLQTLFDTKLEVKGLVPGTTYTFKVEANRAGGSWTVSGPELTVTKGNGDQEPPVISDVRPADQAVVYTPDPVISAVITDSGLGLARITVIVDGKFPPLDRIYNEETRTMTATVHGLSDGRHTLRIVADDKVDNSAESITSFIVAPAPSGPVWPEGSTLTASNVTSSSLTLSWTLAQGASGYRIYRDGSVAGSVYGSVYSYDVAELQPDTTYTFTVEAVDAAGNVSQNNPATTVKTKASQGPAEAVRLQARPGFLNVGSALDLEVRADQAEDVYAFLAKMQYDPAKFKLLQASLHPEFGTEGTTAVRGYNAPAPDRVHVSGSLLAQTPGRSGDVGLAALRFSVLQQGSGTFTLQPDSQLANSQGTIRTLPGPVTLTVRVGSADFDQDGRIGLSDLVLISQRSGARVGQPGYDSLFDLNNDGVIDGTDVQFVADKIAG